MQMISLRDCFMEAYLLGLKVRSSWAIALSLLRSHLFSPSTIKTYIPVLTCLRVALNNDTTLRVHEVHLIALAIGVSPCELFEYLCVREWNCPYVADPDVDEQRADNTGSRWHVARLPSLIEIMTTRHLPPWAEWAMKKLVMKHPAIGNIKWWVYVQGIS